MRNCIALLALTCCVSAAAAQSLADRTILVRSVAPKVLGPALQAYGVTREDLRLIRSLAPSIQTLVPIRHIPKLSVRVGDQTTESVITGTTDQYERGKSLEVVRGRFLTAADVANHHNVAVIHAEQASKLFANQDPIGQAIHFNKEFFTVVGVMEADLPPAIYIPYSTMHSRLGDRTTIRNAGTFEMRQYELSEIEVVLLTKVDVFKTIEIIRHILKQNHSKQDFEVEVKR